MTSIKTRIQNAAKEILQQNPEGVNFSRLKRSLIERFPDISEETIHGYTHALDRNCPTEIAKPLRGLFKWIGTGESVSEIPSITPQVVETPQIIEESFYLPFAKWLELLGECKIAKPVGGSLLGQKWNTPDVMGITEPIRGSMVEFPIEIVSAEIKVTTSITSCLEGFGQA